MNEDKHSIFMHQQIPTDYSCLQNVLNCLPCNLDGLTERLGQFLLFEVKSGEQLSVGQLRMLKALAALPQFTILLVNCQWAEPNEKGGRPFIPESFRVMDHTGAPGPEFQTSVGDFAARYDTWCRTPDSGHVPFTCTPAEFQNKYLRMLPGCQQAGALKHVLAARPDVSD